MKNKILVTPRSVTKGGHPALDRLREAGYEVVFCTPGVQPSEEELINLLPGCVAYLAGVEKITARVLEAAKDLQLISRNGVGNDNIDLEVAQKQQIQVYRTGDANSRGVAELTLSLMLSLARSIPFSDEKMKKGVWQRGKGMELKNRILGLIGCGRIGKEVACLALGVGMKVIAYDPYSHAFFTPSSNFEYVNLDEVLKRSDVISIHIPGSETGEPLINKEFLGKVKKGVLIINTARGTLIDEDAMMEALENETVAGFATDVFKEEPPRDMRLVQHEKVIATPHIGGYTVESVDRAIEVAVSNILNGLKPTERNK